nr:nitroreductase family protein [uncultured Eisenbergiella sp.]
MDLKTAILSRRSVRSFQEDIPVPDDVIQEMLQMAQAAPSGGNGQNHIFGIVRDKRVKTELAEAAMLFANASPLIPAEHIFLTAVTHGLSACFVGWLDIKKAGSILELPSDIACLFLLPVGYPKEEPGPKETKSIEEISFYDIYGGDSSC